MYHFNSAFRFVHNAHYCTYVFLAKHENAHFITITCSLFSRVYQMVINPLCAYALKRGCFSALSPLNYVTTANLVFQLRNCAHGLSFFGLEKIQIGCSKKHMYEDFHISWRLGLEKHEISYYFEYLITFVKVGHTVRHDE